MTDLLVRLTLAISETAELALVAKATAMLAVGLSAVWMLRRGAASVHALTLTATFVVLGLLPLGVLLAPPLLVPLPAPATPVIVAPVPDLWMTAVPYHPGDLFPPAFSGALPAPTPQPWAIDLPTGLRLAWMVGAALVFAPVIATIWHLGRVRRAGARWPAGETLAHRLVAAGGLRRRIAVLRHDGVPVPMTFGLRRPVLLLPWDAEAWSDADLERAFVHEIEHVRRGDWLLLLLARLVLAVYWFHPLAWVAWGRLHLAVERACDDAVLRRGEAGAYATQLIRLAERLSGREWRMLPAMAARGDLSVRVRAIIQPHTLRRRVGVGETAAALATAMLCLLAIAPLAAQVSTGSAAMDLAFEVATIRPNPDPRTPAIGQVVWPRQNRLEATHVTVRDLIRYAYNYQFLPVSFVAGGPNWLDAERYDLVAQALASFPRSERPGLLPPEAAAILRALLADRMQLRVRIERQERPIYALVLDRADGRLGPNLRPAAGILRITRGLARAADGSVSIGPGEPRDIPCRGSVEPLTGPADNRPSCGITSDPHPDGGSVLGLRSWSMPEVASMLSNFPEIDMFVRDATGLSGRWDIDLHAVDSVTRSGNAAPVARPLGDFPVNVPTVPGALRQQLGLRLERTRGEVEVIVIEHVERPSEN